MKLLLTSGGVTNASIERSLIGMLGKPIGEAHALCIPTAQWGHPMCGPRSARGFVSGVSPWGSLTALPWASLGLLELTALPTIEPQRWMAWVEEADVLLVDGGDATYLAHHLRQRGLADRLRGWDDKVWVGVSAGSMVLTPRIGSSFVEWSGASDDTALGLVDFALFPHLDVFPTNTLEHAVAWAEDLDCPSYVLDDQSAISVVDGAVEVVSEGHWHRLP